MSSPIQSFKELIDNEKFLKILKIENNCKTEFNIERSITIKKIKKTSVSIEFLNLDKEKIKMTFYFLDRRFININKHFPEYDDNGYRTSYLQLFC